MPNKPSWAGRMAGLAAAVCVARADVVINEIMYHPASEDSREEYVELLNTGPTNIDVTAWRLTSGVHLAFSGALAPDGTSAVPAGPVIIPPAGLLVVAADVVQFAAKYPAVTHVIGGWTGALSNTRNTIRLENAAGQKQDEVMYADEGDWAIRQRGPLDRGYRGWKWFALHDGTDLNTASGQMEGGSSLELVNPLLPNESGQNWAASAASNGTPGAANSTAATNIGPLVIDVAHYPPVPGTGDPVTVTARVLDEQATGVTVTLHYRNHSTTTPPAFGSAAMFDDGAHGDGLAGDRIFGAVIPAQTNGAIIEFYVRVQDAQANARTWPAPARLETGSYTQACNAIFQIDDNLSPPASSNAGQPMHRLVLTETERAELAAIRASSTARDGNQEMNCTFISTDAGETKIRYRGGVRIRGEGSRNRTPTNLRVNLPSETPWDGLTALNFNTQFIHAQLVGNTFALLSGLPAEAGRVVQMRLNGVNEARSGLPNNGTSTGSGFGSHILLEPMNNEWADRHFPFDGNGNVYRASIYPWYANLDYEGTNVYNYTNAADGGYFKTSNASEDDWSDLIRLTYAMSSLTPDSNYVAAVQSNANVRLFLRYVAVMCVLSYNENGLGNGVGDDYAMYRGIADPRFLLLPHDFDTILGQGEGTMSPTWSIWRIIENRTNTAANQRANFLTRMMRFPAFAPVYFEELKRLCDTTYSAPMFGSMLEQALGGWVPDNIIADMKAFANTRRASVLSQIPTALSATTSLAVINGFPRTNGATVSVLGTAPAIETRSVLVNGVGGTWSAWEGRFANTIPLRPGLNNVLVQALDANGAEVARTNFTVWRDTGVTNPVGGSITGSVYWAATGGPYRVTNNLTVADGGTLTIEAGASVYLAAGVNLTVANGGRILAEGTETNAIHFAPAPGSGTSWGNLTIDGSVGSPETRLAHVHLEGNGNTCIQVTAGTVFLDHLTFGTTAYQYLSLDSASFVVRECVFPTATAAFEPVHGTGGVKPGGRGLFVRNFFGAANGYNDVIDFAGGPQRPAPIVHFLDNVFIGSGDDLLDLDDIDAWIQGNILLHAHKNGSPDTSSAISGGTDSGITSDLTVIGNLIYDCDHVALAKQGNFYTFLNNTMVRQNHQGGLDTTGTVMVLADNDMTEGAGMYCEANIIYDAEGLLRNRTNAVMTFTNNFMPFAWAGPGGGNSTNDPRLTHIPQLSETTGFTSWAQAQVMWPWFRPRAGSPALGAGPNGRDVGGVVPLGASISGEPPEVTPLTTATLTVGTARSGSGIPTNAYPNGAGFTHYTWRLDGGAWSAETPIGTPLALAGLSNGPHRVEVVGKLDSALYQDDAEFAPDDVVTTSRTWTVDTSRPALRLNEILAWNMTAVITNGESPDWIELYNAGPGVADLSGCGLTDDPANPYQFSFPSGAALGPGQYLTLFADNGPNPTNYLGFGLGQNGDAVYLFDHPTNGALLLDSVAFGLQIPDFSVGRQADGSWGLCRPTFGAGNVAQPPAPATSLRINEWLASGLPAAPDDFIELYNLEPAPVALGGLHLTDEPVGAPAMHEITGLSYIPAGGYRVFKADGNTNSGAEHLNFRLAPEQGRIGLFDQDLNLIDQVFYGPQTPGMSYGRSPSGSNNFAFFSTPTPASGNPYVSSSYVMTNLVTLTNTVWRFRQDAVNLGTSWRTNTYDDSTWPTGKGLFGLEPSAPYPYTYPIATPLQLATGTVRVWTYYFRTRFVAPTNAGGGFIVSVTNEIYLDDGAVFYLNGVEVGRLRIGANPVVYNSAATNQPSEGVREAIVIPLPAVVPGTNLLAVEVHQTNTNSTDVVFGMALTALFDPSDRVYLNEVMADNASVTNADGTVTDWIELFNSAADSMSVAGFGLSDDPGTPQRWVFPAGASVPPGGFLRVRCDPALPPSLTNGPALNTGFGLDAQGDAVYIFDGSMTLYDSLVFGAQAADFTLGRVPDGTTNWALALPTPGGANIAAALGDEHLVRINEWAATVPGGPDWFELFNPGPQPVALGGLYLTDKLSNRTKHPIAARSYLGVTTNGFLKFIADNDTAQGPTHVGFALDGVLGEAIGLFSPGTDPAIDTVTFGPQTPGVSQGRFPDASANYTFFASPSPGSANWLSLTNIVINEVLTHTDLPLEDAIELRNLSDAPVDVGGWYISDDPTALRKFRIPDGTVIPARGYKVFYEFEINPPPDVGIGFSFSSAKGDEAWLVQMDPFGDATGYRDTVQFGPQFNGVSFGRFPTSAGVDFPSLSALTFGTAVTAQSPINQIDLFRTGGGASNAYPRVGPVVISEIMYHPPAAGTNDNVDEEFIELQNISGVPVPLYDVNHPTNGWKLRDAVDFRFNTSHTLPAGGYLLVVSFDPATNAAALTSFRTAYGTNGTIVGPYSGKLDNGGESVELAAPDNPQTVGPDIGLVPYVLVDQVVYGDTSPWPTNADGAGPSLQRLSATGYGNEPTNWIAAAPTAAAPREADTDGDGMPDSWEDTHGLNRLVDDAAGDPDGDGFSNLEEYIAGTDPQVSGSYLRLSGVAPAGGMAQVRFLAQAGRTYSVFVADTLANPLWLKLGDVAAPPVTQPVVVPDSGAPEHSTRIYLLVTPAVP